ncbi:MAG: HD domain-containing phosphohydrolase [bacterium]
MIDFKIILQAILDQSMILAHAERGQVLLLDDTGAEKALYCKRVVRGKLVESFSRIPNKEITNKVIKTGKASALKSGTRAVLCIPLQSENQVFGYVYVDRKLKKHLFAENELDIIQSLTGFASLALTNARLHNQLQERTDKLQMLNELSRSISAASYLSTVIRQVLQYCLTITKADKGLIFLGSELEYKGGITKAGKDIAKSETDKLVNHAVLKKVLLSGQALQCGHEGFSNHSNVHNFSLKKRAGSAMCVPMVINNQVFGVVFVSSNHADRHDEKKLVIFESIVNQAGLAVENAQLLENQQKHINSLEKAMNMYKKTQEKSNIDQVTDLCNPGYFVEQVAREYSRAKHYENKLSIIFIDIDSFKEINEIYGYEVSNSILKRIAGVIKTECRRTDLSARYGGDELIVVLENIDVDRTFIIAERIRNNIHKISIGGDQDSRKISVSIGVAEMKEIDSTVDDFLTRAREAQDAARSRGGNRVCRWGDSHEVSVEQIREKISLGNGDSNEILSVLTAISSIKDKSTSWHSLEMGELAVQIGKEYSLSRKQIDDIKIASILHDIGKIGIPDAVLKKKGLLTDKEWKIMRSHPTLGRDIVKRSTNLRKLSQAIYYHHERWDGKGYPEGLKGEQIPISARIIAILDAFEAMVCDRPYRKALRMKEAFKEIERGSGTQFDPKLVKIFLKNKSSLLLKELK